MQTNKIPVPVNRPIKVRNTIALLVGVVLGAIALAESVSSDLHVPAVRMLAAECQGFEALASAGGRPLNCAADMAGVGGGDTHDAQPAPHSEIVPVTLRRKA